MAKKKNNCYGDSETFSEWIRGPTFAIYTNYILSAWGDWMWLFAAGLYLVYLAEGSLRLAAIFGFTAGTLMLLLGGIIGDWVDRNGRMKVVCISLFVQNISVALCATSVCLALVYHGHLYGPMGGYLRPLVEAIIIGLALVAFLASVAYKIAIEKDWIVVVAAGNTAQLTNLNAVTRAIDLSSKILAPTIAGLIMSYSHIIAAICIAVWNVVSVFCEFALLRRVYRLVPELAIKGAKSPEIKEYEMKDLKQAEAEEKEPMKASDTNSLEKLPITDQEQPKADDEQNLTPNGINLSEEKQPLETDTLSGSTGSLTAKGTKPAMANSTRSLTTNGSQSAAEDDKKAKRSCCRMMLDPLVTLIKGWKTYMKQRVVFAGLALAFLYMTVLGFDYVTTGYIYANGVDEKYVGISMALAGITGIMGTFMFSYLNKRLGLERTGMIAFISEILCLTLTLASIWAPGSVYDPTFSKPEINCTGAANTTAPVPVTMDVNHTAAETRTRRDISSFYRLALPNVLDESQWQQDVYHVAQQAGDDLLIARMNSPHSLDVDSSGRMRRDILSESSENAVANGDTKPPTEAQIEEPIGGDTGQCQKTVTVSVVLFLIGIVTSRIGLWMADLVVTQLLQENVEEMERGIVNGVQNSLNMLMDMIKNALVIALPSVQTFGILIILSFIFICTAGGLFLTHVFKVDRSVLSCGGAKKARQHAVVDEVNVEKTLDVV